MSGGSLDYFYSRLEDVAERLKSKENTELVRAFGDHLVLCAEALHDIEWVWSSDTSPGDEVEAIQRALGSSAATAEALILKKDAEALIEKLQQLTKLLPN